MWEGVYSENLKSRSGIGIVKRVVWQDLVSVRRQAREIGLVCDFKAGGFYFTVVLVAHRSVLISFTGLNSASTSVNSVSQRLLRYDKLTLLRHNGLCMHTCANHTLSPYHPFLPLSFIVPSPDEKDQIENRVSWLKWRDMVFCRLIVSIWRFHSTGKWLHN